MLQVPVYVYAGWMTCTTDDDKDRTAASLLVQYSDQKMKPEKPVRDGWKSATRMRMDHAMNETMQQTEGCRKKRDPR